MYNLHFSGGGWVVLSTPAARFLNIVSFLLKNTKAFVAATSIRIEHVRERWNDRRRSQVGGRMQIFPTPRHGTLLTFYLPDHAKR